MKTSLIDCPCCKKEISIPKGSGYCPKCSSFIGSDLAMNIANELKNRLNRKPSIEEVAKELDITPATLEDWCNTIVDTYSSEDIFNHKFNELKNRELKLFNTFKNDVTNKPLNIDDISDVKKKVDKALANLTHDERAVITCFYFHNASFKKISEISPLRKRKVRKLFKKAYEKIDRQLSQ